MAKTGKYICVISLEKGRGGLYFRRIYILRKMILVFLAIVIRRGKFKSTVNRLTFVVNLLMLWFCTGFLLIVLPTYYCLKNLVRQNYVKVVRRYKLVKTKKLKMPCSRVICNLD